MISTKLRLSALALTAALTLTLGAGCATPNSSQGTDQKTGTTAKAGATKKIVDMAGDTIEVPVDPTNVSPLVGPGYEKIILLGAVDKVSITGNKLGLTSWAKVVSPDYAKIPVVNNSTEPNVEELVNKGVQVAFFWNTYPEATKKMQAAGIKVVTTQVGNEDLKSVDGFVDFQLRETKVFAETLGDQYLPKYEKWATYYRDKVTFMRGRLAKTDPATYPKVYYVRGPEALSTHGGASYTRWLIEIAGGNIVTKDVNKGLYTSTMEEIVKQDPEYIFMGRTDNPDLVKKDPAWQNIKAVKNNNKVFLNPTGVGPIDYSSENILMALGMAKDMHPDLFADVDMAKEAKNYFKQFYNYDMSDAEAALYLAHKKPAA